MDLAGLIFKIVLLGGLPIAFLLGILKTKTYWPVTFCTFVGATICAINFRTFATLADLDPKAWPSGDFYRLLAWLICPILLIAGIRKLLRLRAAQALAELNLDEE